MCARRNAVSGSSQPNSISFFAADAGMAMSSASRSSAARLGMRFLPRSDRFTITAELGEVMRVGAAHAFSVRQRDELLHHVIATREERRSAGHHVNRDGATRPIGGILPAPVPR